MNSDDDTIVETSIDTVTEVLFIEKREKDPRSMSFEPASIDGWPAYRSTDHHKYRSPFNCVDRYSHQ